jgi:hypothetical protein
LRGQRLCLCGDSAAASPRAWPHAGGAGRTSTPQCASSRRPRAWAETHTARHISLLSAALALTPGDACEFEVAARSRPARRASAGCESPRQETNLPAQQPRLIGRARDTAGLCQALLRAEGCLVTVVGPGGVGKTCLALDTANVLRSAHVDGAWFVDLSSVAESGSSGPRSRRVWEFAWAGRWS